MQLQAPPTLYVAAFLCCAVVVTEAYLSAAEYKGAECKYTEVYGIDTNLNLGGGAQQFTFRRSAQASCLKNAWEIAP
jgi:hypothetical protein